MKYLHVYATAATLGVVIGLLVAASSFQKPEQPKGLQVRFNGPPREDVGYVCALDGNHMACMDIETYMSRLKRSEVSE